MIMGLDRTYHAYQFIFSLFFLHFLFVPCGRLSWLSVSVFLHVKYTVSYRIVNCRLVAVVKLLLAHCNCPMYVDVHAVTINKYVSLASEKYSSPVTCSICYTGQQSGSHTKKKLAPCMSECFLVLIFIK